jgi:WD40 repeat protein
MRMAKRIARPVPRVLSEPAALTGEELTAVDLSPDGKTIVIGGSFSIRSIDVVSGKDRTLKPNFGAVWAARFTPDGRKVLGGVGDHFIAWKSTGEVAFEAATHGIVRRISTSRDGKVAATSTWEKDVRVWDLAKGRELGGFTLDKSLVNGSALSPDGKLVACGGSDGFARIFDARTGALVKATAGKGWIDVVERGGAMFATAGRAAQVVLWSWSGEKGRVLGDMTTAITVLGVSPDGKWVAACGKKAAPLVWSTKTGKVVAALEGHEKVGALCFSSDSRSIVTAGEPLVRIWEMPE